MKIINKRFGAAVLALMLTKTSYALASSDYRKYSNNDTSVESENNISEAFKQYVEDYKSVLNYQDGLTIEQFSNAYMALNKFKADSEYDASLKLHYNREITSNDFWHYEGYFDNQYDNEKIHWMLGKIASLYELFRKNPMINICECDGIKELKHFIEYDIYYLSQGGMWFVYNVGVGHLTEFHRVYMEMAFSTKTLNSVFEPEDLKAGKFTLKDNVDYSKCEIYEKAVISQYLNLEEILKNGNKEILARMNFCSNTK